MVKFFKVVRTRKDQIIVKDLNETEKPDNKWLVKFHLDKCKVMHVQGKRHKTSCRK